jgi:hypothetical protein
LGIRQFDKFLKEKWRIKWYYPKIHELESANSIIVEINSFTILFPISE